jgi:hypothetical protein
VARERPTASNVVHPALVCLDGGKPDADDPRLTRAEARALRRTAPLTHAQLEKHFSGVLLYPQQSA